MSGLKRGDEALERAGVEPVEHEAHAVGFPRLVGAVVDDAEDGRRPLHELDVELRVKIAEEPVGEAQRIDVAHFADAGLLAENFLQRLGGADVAGAGAGGKDQDPAAVGIGRRLQFQLASLLLGAKEPIFEIGHALGERAWRCQ